MYYKGLQIQEILVQLQPFGRTDLNYLSKYTDAAFDWKIDKVIKCKGEGERIKLKVEWSDDGRTWNCNVEDRSFFSIELNLQTPL